MTTQYMIRSLERHDDNAASLFMAINGYSALFTRDAAKARKFNSEVEADAYAIAEIFTQKMGVYDVIPVKS